MGILWMVDGVFCRDPSLGLHLEERMGARASAQGQAQARSADQASAVAVDEASSPVDSYYKKFPSPQAPSGDTAPVNPQQIDLRAPELPIPPPNSEVAAQPRADLENRASEMPKNWERVTAIERTAGVHRRLDTLDSSTATVRDLMSRAVLTATSSTPVAEALELLDETDFHHLPVVDQEQKLVGVVSDRDLLGQQGELKEFMESTVLTASPDTALEQAAQAMAKKRFHSLVVLDDKRRPLGMLTSSDLLAFLVSHPAMRLWQQG
jgi:CBS domain-containing membrane protein